jgi:hypothetical protein
MSVPGYVGIEPSVGASGECNGPFHARRNASDDATYLKNVRHGYRHSPTFIIRACIFCNRRLGLIRSRCPLQDRNSTIARIEGVKNSEGQIVRASCAAHAFGLSTLCGIDAVHDGDASGDAIEEVKLNGVADGTRTHDNRNHNPGLYQLSYSHH